MRVVLSLLLLLLSVCHAKAGDTIAQWDVFQGEGYVTQQVVPKNTEVRIRVTNKGELGYLLYPSDAALQNLPCGVNADPKIMEWKGNDLANA